MTWAPSERTPAPCACCPSERAALLCAAFGGWTTSRSGWLGSSTSTRPPAWSVAWRSHGGQASAATATRTPPQPPLQLSCDVPDVVVLRAGLASAATRTWSGPASPGSPHSPPPPPMSSSIVRPLQPPPPKYLVASLPPRVLQGAMISAATDRRSARGRMRSGRATRTLATTKRPTTRSCTSDGCSGELTHPSCAPTRSPIRTSSAGPGAMACRSQGICGTRLRDGPAWCPLSTPRTAPSRPAPSLPCTRSVRLRRHPQLRSSARCNDSHCGPLLSRLRSRRARRRVRAHRHLPLLRRPPRRPHHDGAGQCHPAELAPGLDPTGPLVRRRRWHRGGCVVRRDERRDQCRAVSHAL